MALSSHPTTTVSMWRPAVERGKGASSPWKYAKCDLEVLTVSEMAGNSCECTERLDDLCGRALHIEVVEEAVHAHLR